MPAIGKVETIDMTPTWAEAVEMLICTLENGTHRGKEIARAELRRMALITDQYAAAGYDATEGKG